MRSAGRWIAEATWRLIGACRGLTALTRGDRPGGWHRPRASRHALLPGQARVDGVRLRADGGSLDGTRGRDCGSSGPAEALAQLLPVDVEVRLQADCVVGAGGCLAG